MYTNHQHEVNDDFDQTPIEQMPEEVHSNRIIETPVQKSKTVSKEPSPIVSESNNFFSMVTDQPKAQVEQSP